jgi:hypothetical protein
VNDPEHDIPLGQELLRVQVNTHCPLALQLGMAPPGPAGQAVAMHDGVHTSTDRVKLVNLTHSTFAPQSAALEHSV